jgi:Protein of unknown function (DUF3768)
MTTETATTAPTIADLNDRFRKGDRTLGKHMASARVNALTSEQQQELTRLVRVFNDFTEGNDPHGERDFGSVELNEEKYLWKIDYYDLSYDYGSEDPSDLAQTRRVLTIMHSSEY